MADMTQALNQRIQPEIEITEKYEKKRQDALQGIQQQMNALYDHYGNPKKPKDIMKTNDIVGS